MKTNTTKKFQRFLTLAISTLFINNCHLHATATTQVAIITGDVSNIAQTGTDATQTLTTLAAAIAPLATSTGLASAVAPLATASGLSAVDGHVTTLGNSALATATNLATLQTTADTTNTAVVTTIPATLTAIKGASFDTATDSLHVISGNITNLTTAAGSLATVSDTDAIKANTLAIEGSTLGFNTAFNSLAALTGTGTGAGKSGSTNTFSPSTQSLADIAGASFATATDSLHAIATAISSITPVDGVATYAQAEEILTAVQTDIPADITAAVADLATSAELTTAVAGLATSAELTTAVAGLATSAELTTAVAGLATSAELTTAVADLATSAELTTAVADLATSAELSSVADSITAQSTTLSNMELSLGVLITKLAIDPVTQTSTAKGNASLTTALTFATTPGNIAALSTAYNTALANALSKSTIAVTAATQRYANTSIAITAVASAITAFTALSVECATRSVVPSSTKSLGQVSAALVQLQAALGYLLINQSQASA